MLTKRKKSPPVKGAHRTPPTLKPPSKGSSHGASKLYKAPLCKGSCHSFAVTEGLFIRSFRRIIKSGSFTIPPPIISAPLGTAQQVLTWGALQGDEVLRHLPGSLRSKLLHWEALM